MRRQLKLTLYALLFLSLYTSCKSEKKPTGPPVVEDRTYQKIKGTDCDKPDTLRTDCAIIDFLVPQLKAGTASSDLIKNVNRWVDNYLISLLIYSDYPKDNPEKMLKTLDAAVKRFHEMHKEAEGSVMAGAFAAQSSYETLLNDGKYLTLKLTGDCYQGGNHGMKDDVAIASFDLATGKQLSWNDLVNNPTAWQSMAEDKFNQVTRFNYPDDTKFALPAAYGLTSKGLLLHYMNDEIYGLEGAKNIVMPYSDMGALLKITAPLAAPGDAEEEDEYADDEADITFAESGDHIIIPTFEIEVLQSAKSTKLLAKQKETVKVLAYFFGYPTNDADADEVGQYQLLDHEVELTGGNRIARFEGLKIPKADLAKLSDKNFDLLINVVSGRKSSEDNLLSCGLVQALASTFSNRRYVVSCTLIPEPTDVMSTSSVACYALPAATGTNPMALLVDCNKEGKMEWAGTEVRDLEQLKKTMRWALQTLKAAGMKTVPPLETSNCLMGTSGEIRTTYDEVKSEMEKGGTVPTTTSATRKSTDEPKSSPKKEKPASGSVKSSPAPKSTSASKTRTSGKSITTPIVTLNANGETTLNGKKVSLDNLKKELQSALLLADVIPEKLDLKTIGETGMGMRAEVNTNIVEAIEGANWKRKKAALEMLNTALGKKLGIATQFDIGVYNAKKQYAYISGIPKQSDGTPIDYSKTTFAKEAQAKTFVNKVNALMKYENGKWNLLVYHLGEDKPHVKTWVEKFKAPKDLFGK